MNFSKIIYGIKEGFKISGYSRTASELDKLSDKQLADIGISRELLKQGAKAYPWRKEEQAVSPLKLASITSLNVTKSIENTPSMPIERKVA